jgi:hypothetical protein
MGLDLAKMRAKAEEQQGGKKKGENDASFWKPPSPSEGQSSTKTKVRLVLPPDGDPLRMLYFHYGLKGQGGVMCLAKNFGEKCPICDFASKLWKAGKHDEAKKLFVKERFYAPVVVRGEEEKGVRWWNLNFTNYKKILHDMILDQDFQEAVSKDITDLETGVDLVVKREKPGNGMQYDVISVSPDLAGKSALSSSSKEAQKLLSTLKPLDDLMKRKTLKEVEEILDLHMNGVVEKEVGGDDKSTESSSEGMSLDDLAKEIESDD